MSEQYCEQCPKRCPVNDLHCNRGRVQFGQEPVERQRPTGPLGLLQRCGSALHHGHIGEEEALSVLTEQERAELERLLSVLLADWEKRMPQGRGRHERR